MPSKNFNQRYYISISILLACLLAFASLFSPTTKADEAKLLEQNLSLRLQNLSQKIDARIVNMKLIAKTIANDTHIHQWVENGFEKEQEHLLVQKLGFLVNEYGLTSASFADKNTNKYWNHEGFLRVLQPDIDTWYFAYLASKEQDLISVYHDQNKNRVDIYVNYQQTEANGLSGIATSFDGILEMMSTSVLAKQGEVYLIDSAGKVQVHANAKVAGTKSLQQMYSNEAFSALLKQSAAETFKINTPSKMLLSASYIPSMTWYLVVAIPQ